MRLADISIKRPVLTTVMVSALVVFGLVAYGRIGVDLNPNVEFPVVTVTAVYPGADPETIETKVVDKLEEAINTVAGLKHLSSTSLESVGLVVAQFALELRVQVPATQLAAMRPGAAVLVSIPATGRALETRVARLVPSANPQTRTFLAVCEVANPGHALRPGLFAEVRPVPAPTEGR